MSTLHPTFAVAIERTHGAMRDYSRIVRTERWQGVDVSKRPEASMREIVGWDFRVPMTGEDLDLYRRDIQPNLPWADIHFEERVCGYPMNPGESWKIWPWAQSASNFTDEKGRFEVNYMERFWAAGEFEDTPREGESTRLTGIRGRRYGDLGSIIDLLEREPFTRQAYMPIFFPEDTGAGGRVPCTLGYHWMVRSGHIHVHYPIRSCDYYRHFRDDIYLCIRLTFWILQQLRSRNPRFWDKITPGYYSMWIGSLHMFVNDYVKVFGRPAAE